MTKTIYLITHVDEPSDHIMEVILDPYDGYSMHFTDLAEAQKKLEEDYLKNGLEYTIRTVTIIID